MQSQSQWPIHFACRNFNAFFSCVIAISSNNYTYNSSNRMHGKWTGVKAHRQWAVKLRLVRLICAHSETCSIKAIPVLLFLFFTCDGFKINKSKSLPFLCTRSYNFIGSFISFQILRFQFNECRDIIQALFWADHQVALSLCKFSQKSILI